MKVAVSSTGKELESAVDQRFGRADYLVIVDTETNAIVQVIDNLAAKEAAHGAGINAAAEIARAGAQAILTGYVGPKAAAVCEKAGIMMVNGAEGTVRATVQRFIDTHAAQAAGAVSPASRVGAAASQPAGGAMRQGRGLGGGRRRGQCDCQGRNRQGR